MTNSQRTDKLIKLAAGITPVYGAGAWQWKGMYCPVYELILYAENDSSLRSSKVHPFLAASIIQSIKEHLKMEVHMIHNSSLYTSCFLSKLEIFSSRSSSINLCQYFTRHKLDG